MSEAWKQAQDFEAEWWGDCCSTYGEETKQLTYAARMGLVAGEVEGRYPVYDMGGKSVLDMGGGPVSMLLKCVNLGTSIVVDPAPYPAWVARRYLEHGVGYLPLKGEDFVSPSDLLEEATDTATVAALIHDMRFDEGWLYNCLQHTEDPERVIHNLRDSAKVIRVFEWVNGEVNAGHPHSLRPEDLRRWLGSSRMPAYGLVEAVHENGAVGEAFHTVIEPERR